MHEGTNNTSPWPVTYRLEGEIVDIETGFGIADLRIDVVDKDGCCTDLVGTAKSDRFGRFHITLSSDYLDSILPGRTPILAFRVYKYVEAGDPPFYQKFNDPAESWTLSTTVTRIRIGFDLNEDRTVTSPYSSIVRGRVLDSSEKPIEGIRVIAYDKGLQTNTILGRYSTEDDGWYYIRYAPTQLNRVGKMHADLIVRAFAPGDDENAIADTGVLCHAPTTAIVNLIKGNVAVRGQSEEQRVLSQITTVIGPTAPIATLTEEQIAHIACTMEGDRELIATYVKSAQIAETMELPAAAIYALLRQGLPPSRRGILAHQPAVLHQAYERAVIENILAAEDDTPQAIDQIVNALVEKAVELAFEPREGGGTSLGDVLAPVLAESDREIFVREFINNEGAVSTFWSTLAQLPAFTASAEIPRLQRLMQWGALTRYHAPLVAKLDALWTSEPWTSVRNVAKYDDVDWKAILDLDTPLANVAIGCPPDTPGATEDARRTNFAKILERSVETAFPTAVIGARIIRSNDDADLTTFFGNNPDFDFATTRVATYLAAHNTAMAGVVDPEATTRKLEAIERLFRVTRRYPEIKALLDAGLHSSQSIQRLGRSRFVARFSGSLGPQTAERIFGRACWIASTAAALYTKYGAQLHGLPVFSLPDLASSSDNPQAIIADWATLFGNADTCACVHCRSVYGPAAYLVDLLDFLERQNAEIETSASTPEAPLHFSARDVLIGYSGTDANKPTARRPDIAHLSLSCENTNTTLPYIDLVNEILEVAVANLVDEPDHLWPDTIDTTKSSNELLAEPEITHPTARIVAYTELAHAVHPFELPFHFWETETRAYLEHLGAPRYALVETFIFPKKPFDPDVPNQIARERLRLSARAWDVLRGATISGVDPNDYWGVAPGATWWSGDGTIEEVPRFLQQSGLSFDHLRELLATDYLGNAIHLSPEQGCNIDEKSLTGLTEAILGRTHRFLRLRKKLGLSITEVDWIFKSFGLADLDEEPLCKISDALALQKDLDVPLPVVLSFWGDMSTRSYKKNTALYEQLFLTKAISQLSTEFAAVAQSDGNAASTTPILQLAVGVMLGLRIQLDELAMLMVDNVSESAMHLPALLSSGAFITMTNVSRLHRVVAFARAIRMSTRDYLVLRELSGMNVLEGDVGGTTPDPADTRAFVALVNQLRASGLTVPEIHYVVRHVEMPPTNVGIASETVDRIVDELEKLAGDVAKDVAASDKPSNTHVALIHERLDEAVPRQLAAEMQVDVKIVTHLLRHELHSVVVTSDGALRDFYHDTTATTNDRKNLVVRLYKAVLLVKRLKFDVTQLQWLYVDSPVAWLELDELPIERNDTVANYRAKFAALARLVEFSAVRDLFPDAGEALVSVLDLAKKVNAGTANETAFYDEIALRVDLEFKGGDVKSLSDTHFGYKIVPIPEQPVPDFQDERALGNVVRALKTLHDLGATVAQGITWSNLDIPLPQTPLEAEEITLDLKHLVQAKYDDAAWPTAARPIRDGLREAQRDALVGYLISADDDVTLPNDLFAKLLIDVEMSPCQLTSRIKQAISSVQTFVQRSFLGLEDDVKLDENAAGEWEWLKSYRVWEANRKVFLYPENWTEPELRDDKTPFFATLESGLNQGEIDTESAERVYVEYLDELHGVSRLDIAAVCHEREDDGDCKGIDTVHVIARTHASPHIYYYRKRVEGSWTPWEKVDAQIQGDHLMATIWNRRLYLIWPTFEQAADNPQPPNGPVQQNWRVSLAWSTYETNGFGPVHTTKALFFMMPDVALKWTSFVVGKQDNDLLVSCLVNWYGLMNNVPTNTRWSVVAGTFAFQPCLGEWTTTYNAPPLTTWLGRVNIPVWTPITATTEFMRLAEVNLPVWSINPDVIPPPDDTFRFPRFNGAPIVLLEKTPGRYFMHMDRTVLNVTSPLGPRDAFFYIDATRTFFVEKRFRIVTAWTDPGGAYPNMPARIARDATRGLDSALIDWGNKAVLDMNSEYTIEEQYRFHTFYHPYACEFIRRLGRDGIDGLLRWSSAEETPVQNLAKLDVPADYEPTKYVYEPFPIENVDFSHGGTYSQYNWELFFHAPFMIATRLSKNGRYDEADKWYRYIFDPTGGAPGDGPERFWNVRPFRENVNLASIQEQLAELSANNPQAQELAALLGLEFDADGGTSIAAQIAQWREKPFNPHLIARMRPVAYQKAVVMKYVQNLLAWGDSLFRRDTMESINEATQLYILASHILGKRPRVVETDDVGAKTYAQLETASADANALLQLEVIVPEPRTTVICCSDRQPAPTWHLPYFCVPHNENMLALWDTVEDRLLKVRCCMNIDGVVRQLPLFEAPLDPGLLVKAAAAGLDLGEVLADVSIPLPKYRFSVLLPKAVEFAGSVAAMGNALLSALEKRDGEALSKLRSTQEIDMLTRVRDVKRRQIEEARETLEGLRRSREVIAERHAYYRDIPKEIDGEKTQRELSDTAMWVNVGAEALHLMTAVSAAVPQIQTGIASLLPFLTVETGGLSVGAAFGALGRATAAAGSFLNAKASLVGTAASYERRWADWKLQEKLAERELTQIDRQIAAAEIRLDIAQKELQNHDQSLKNAKEIDDYLRTKYTREELYEWFITKVKEIYFQAYKVAYDLAKRAQKAFQFELALPNETYLQPAYWDKTTDGLLAGERLQHDLRRMDAAYLELNKREFEITKHVSLAEITPLALLKLREHETEHSCDVNLEEWMFDQDWPGHYLRRIKSVSMSIPVVSGTYAGVNSKLALVTNTVRMTDSLNGGYARTGTSDTRFVDNRVSAQSIVTSSAQQDAGMFELVFRDERYLPFEGAGVEGLWRISLDPKTNRFRLSDAKDVILHIRYMARESGVAQFQTKAEEALELNNGPKGYRLFSAKTDFPGEWAVFTTVAPGATSQTLALPFARKHFQSIRGKDALKITAVQVFARKPGTDTTTISATLCAPGVLPQAAEARTLSLAYNGGAFGRLFHNALVESFAQTIADDSVNGVNSWTLVVPSGLSLDDIWIVCTYQRI